MKIALAPIGRVLIARVLAALVLAGAPLSAVAAQNWNTEFVQTARGHRVGDPAASVQLIEFVSYTCPHCATFEKESDGALRVQYIHEGKVAVEVRPVIRNVVDLAATLTTQCGAQDKFFANHRTMMRAQDDWLAKVNAASETQKARWFAGPVAQRMRAIAADLDFYEMMENRGYSYSEIDQCLGNEARARAIVDLANADSTEFAVPGTPSFAVNGTLLEGVHTWASLQPSLNPAAH